MAPKKAALKEAEAELAVAMEVSVFTLSVFLSLSDFHSFPDLLLHRFPHNSIGVEERARFECCPIFIGKRGKGNEK